MSEANPIATVAEKHCHRCGVTKSIDAFSRNKARRDGHNTYCLPCERQSRQDLKASQDERAERYVKLYREQGGKSCGACRLRKPPGEFARNGTKPDGLSSHCKDCVKLYQDINRAKIKEYNKQYLKTYSQENRDKYREHARRWFRLNREKHLAWRHRRRASIRGGGSYTAEEWLNLCEKYDYMCLCCGKRKPLTVDHVLPLTMGGRNDIGNLQPLCKSCNSRKHAKHIDFRPAHGGP